MVGYGDIYPETDLGRIISMFSAIFGVAVIALPSGVITASYIEELREEKKNKHKTHTQKHKQRSVTFYSVKDSMSFA